jgi:hypothetical protein
MSIPITFMVDDPGPLINVYWWHAAEAQHTDAPLQKSGEPVPRDVPVDLIRQFADVIGRWSIRGKFTVLPYPAGLGKISRGWPGCDTRGLQSWIETVRAEVAPLMDITPEIHTHAKTLDLETFTLLPENERDWASHQTEATLTPYIAEALRFLNEVGLKANGVTSPWNFGAEVEPDYQRAIRAAMKEVNGLGQTWYFLHARYGSNEPCSEVVYRSGADWLVSICSQSDDFFWKSMETREDGAELVQAMADQFLTEDGRGGRLAELFNAGIPIVFHSHWQSLFSNGRRTGLRALDELGRRIRTVWGDRVRWVKCSELAAELASERRG